MNSLKKFETVDSKELVSIKGGELGTLIAIFGTAYIIGSDLARRKKK